MGNKEDLLKDISLWLSKQKYQKEYGEQEYMMYYDVDVPKIVRDYILQSELLKQRDELVECLNEMLFEQRNDDVFDKAQELIKKIKG